MIDTIDQKRTLLTKRWSGFGRVLGPKGVVRRSAIARASLTSGERPGNKDFEGLTTSGVAFDMPFVRLQASGLFHNDPFGLYQGMHRGLVGRRIFFIGKRRLYGSQLRDRYSSAFSGGRY